MKRTILALTLLAVTAGAYATPYADYRNIEYWAGDQGAANRATFVVDYGNDTHYAFGFGWEGTATAWDMIQAIDAAGPLETDHTAFSFGVQVTALDYDGNSMVNSPNWPAVEGDTWMPFWASHDGNNWFNPDVGPSQYAMADGGWAGYTVIDAINTTWPGDQPIPEPATLVLLAGGGVALVMRKRKHPATRV